MVAGLLKVLIMVVAAAAIAAVSLTIVGDSLRQLVPEPYHRAVWLTGLFISVPCAFAAVLVASHPPAKPRGLKNLLLVGAAVGALLYLLFITGVDCTLTPSTGSRSYRLELKCRDLEAP